MPKKQPGRHSQCGPRPNSSAVVGIFSASMVNSAGNITQETLPKRRFLQIFRPRRVFSSCVVNSWRHRGRLRGRLRVCSRLVVSPGKNGRGDSTGAAFSRLGGYVRRGVPNGDATGVPLRSVSSPTLVSSGREVDSAGAKTKASVP